MRTRRDHARFLNLIEVSAFLHEYQRARQDRAIVATVADYAIAYQLGADVLTETLADLQETAPDGTRCGDRAGQGNRRAGDATGLRERAAVSRFFAAHVARRAGKS
jgi:hypothetical protein